jgi:predicted ATPase
MNNEEFVNSLKKAKLEAFGLRNWRIFGTEKLVIKHFGAIDNIVLELKPFIVFIGPQSSGKSTIAKLIDIFRKPRFLNIFNIPSQQKVSTEDYLPFFEHHNLRNFFHENTQLEYICDEYSLHYANGEFKRSFSQKESEHQLGKLSRNPVAEVNLNNLKQLSVMQPLYIPAERSFIAMASGAFFNLISNDVPLPKNILEFGAAFERARSHLRQLPIDFLNVTYKYENNQDNVLLGSEKSIKLSESASGLQAVIPLITTIEANYNHFPRVFIIEEPELNLFPVTQRDLVYYLISRAAFTYGNLGTNELVITTHSPYILAAMNLCLFAHRVAQKHPDKIEDVKAIVPQNSWLKPENFNAYYVGEGTAKTIFNPKTGMISESVLDETSEIIGSDFDELMEIYRQKPHETTT